MKKSYLILIFCAILIAGHFWGNNPGGGLFTANIVTGEQSNTTEGTGNQNPAATEDESDFAGILISLVIILLAAKIGGDLCERIGQPAVLGELVLGVIIGNFYLTGFAGFEQIKHHLST